MTNQNKHWEHFWNFVFKIIPMDSQEQSYGAGFALKAWSKNEPWKKFKALNYKSLNANFKTRSFNPRF